MAGVTVRSLVALSVAMLKVVARILATAVVAKATAAMAEAALWTEGAKATAVLKAAVA